LYTQPSYYCINNPDAQTEKQNSVILILSPYITLPVLKAPETNVTTFKAIFSTNDKASLDATVLATANVAPPEIMLNKFPAMANQQIRDSEFRRPMFC
jgi:hypothetical protein